VQCVESGCVRAVLSSNARWMRCSCCRSSEFPDGVAVWAATSLQVSADPKAVRLLASRSRGYAAAQKGRAAENRSVGLEIMLRTTQLCKAVDGQRAGLRSGVLLPQINGTQGRISQRSAARTLLSPGYSFISLHVLPGRHNRSSPGRSQHAVHHASWPPCRPHPATNRLPDSSEPLCAHSCSALASAIAGLGAYETHAQSDRARPSTAKPPCARFTPRRHTPRATHRCMIQKTLAAHESMARCDPSAAVQWHSARPTLAQKCRHW
jgi:hypothetical protein